MNQVYVHDISERGPMFSKQFFVHNWFWERGNMNCEYDKLVQEESFPLPGIHWIEGLENELQ